MHEQLTITQEFPERPGALRKFLLGMHQCWNISLFHYRNHGAGELTVVLSVMDTDPSSQNSDVGKVLAGVQVPPEEHKEFNDFLTSLGYNYVEETDNEVYKRFLRM